MLHGLFGAPEDVAFRHTLTSAAHGALAGWLRSAEALMRRLLVIEAAAYPKPNTRPLLHARRTRARQLIGFDAEHPEKWRVSFRVLAPPVRPKARTVDVAAFAVYAGGKRRRRRLPREERLCPASQPVTFRSAWPLAERYEALLRVFNDPAPYAKRLAARLHATPHRLREALRAPPDARDRVDRFDELGESAETAWRPHLSSA